MVLEGRRTGKVGSVTLKADGSSYLTATPPPHAGPASVTFTRAAKTPTWTGGPTLRAFSDLASLPAGTYDLELPYEAQSIHATTWFLIGHAGDRFLHPGRASEGCVTVSDVPRWSELSLSHRGEEGRWAVPRTCRAPQRRRATRTENGPMVDDPLP